MATYNQMQSLPVNLEAAGLSGLDPRFLSAIQTAFARSGASGYGGQQAFDLISGADANRVGADPLGYANQLLQQSGIQGFSSPEEWMSANQNLPGHNVSLSPFNPIDVASGVAGAAGEVLQEPGALALLAAGGAGAALGPSAGAAGGGAAAGGTGLNAAYAPTSLGGTGASGLGVSSAYAPPALGGAGSASLGLDAGLAGAGWSDAALLGGGGALAPSGGTSGGPSPSPVGGAGAGISLGQIAAGAIPAAFGAFGANQQARQYGALANQYMAMGAPYRSRLSELYSDPEDWLNSPEVQIPIQQGTNILARSLSTKGNPVGSGNALQELQNYASKQLFDRLGQEKDRLAGFGGLSSYSAAAPSAANAQIGAQKGIYDAIGAGAADVFNPPRRITLQDLLRL